LNHASYFNKICRICCVDTHVQSLKVWLKSVRPWLKYRIFSKGLFFLLAHPVGRAAHVKADGESGRQDACPDWSQSRRIGYSFTATRFRWNEVSWVEVGWGEIWDMNAPLELFTRLYTCVHGAWLWDSEHLVVWRIAAAVRQQWFYDSFWSRLRWRRSSQVRDWWRLLDSCTVRLSHGGYCHFDRSVNSFERKLQKLSNTRTGFFCNPSRLCCIVPVGATTPGE